MKRIVVGLMVGLAACFVGQSPSAQSIGFLGIETSGGGSDSLIKISTVTASASASIQFTSLGGTYDTYLLSCTGLLGSVATTINVQIGEGSLVTPTWETGAHYTTHALFAATGSPLGENAANSQVNTNALGSGGTGGTGSGSTTVPQTFWIMIDNVSSTTLIKNINFKQTFFADGKGYYFVTGAGYWNLDTNAITGIELVPASGNIASGVCTLYGVVK